VRWKAKEKDVVFHTKFNKGICNVRTMPINNKEPSHRILVWGAVRNSAVKEVCWWGISGGLGKVDALNSARIDYRF